MIFIPHTHTADALPPADIVDPHWDPPLASDPGEKIGERPGPIVILHDEAVTRIKVKPDGLLIHVDLPVIKVYR